MPAVPKSEILNFLSLVDYQTDAIVSRQLTKAEGGNVTLFAFDEGQVLSEHTAPYDALVHVVDGDAEIIVSGTPYLLKVGEGIVMPANEPHAIKAVRRFKMMLTMLRS